MNIKVAIAVGVVLVSIGGLFAWVNAPKVEQRQSVSVVTADPIRSQVSPPVQLAAPVASAPQPVQHISRAPTRPATSFGGEKDIWAFAHAALASGRPEDVFEARIATANCLNHLQAGDALQAAAAGASSPLPGRMTPERQLAIADLQARCAGFEKAGKDAARNFRNEISAKLAEQGFKFDPKRGLTPDLLKIGLLSGAPDAMASSTQSLLGPLMKRMNVPSNDPREDLLAQALVLAQCDVGIDCSQSGFKALERCAYAGVCGQQLNEVWDREYDAQNVSQINAYRQEIVAAIKSRDWKTLGLE